MFWSKSRKIKSLRLELEASRIEAQGLKTMRDTAREATAGIQKTLLERDRIVQDLEEKDKVQNSQINGLIAERDQLHRRVEELERKIEGMESNRQDLEDSKAPLEDYLTGDAEGGGVEPEFRVVPRELSASKGFEP